MTSLDSVEFPVYLLRGEATQYDGKWYLIPEPVACDNARDLAVFLYERGLSPMSALGGKQVAAR